MPAPQRHHRQINFNAMVDSGHLQQGDEALLFGDQKGNEKVEVFPPGTTMLDVLVAAGIFRSKGQARKNGVVRRYEYGVKVPNDEGELVWKSIETRVQAKDEPIQPGFSEYTVGKLHHLLTIWNPTE